MATLGVRLERQGAITIVRLERPPANVIDLAFAEALAAQLTELEESGEGEALVITGSQGAFSAGLDLKQVPFYDKEQQAAMVEALNRLFGRLYAFPRPVVAAVNGHAIAGGLVLVLACDYRVGAAGAYQLGLAEVRVGVPYPVAAIAVAQAELPAPAARRLVLSGKGIAPDEALARGVLDEIQSPERLVERAVEVAEEMAKLPRRSFGRIKRQLRAAVLDRIDDAVTRGADPMLRDWLDAETPRAAEAVLRGRL